MWFPAIVVPDNMEDIVFIHENERRNVCNNANGLSALNYPMGCHNSCYSGVTESSQNEDICLHRHMVILNFCCHKGYHCDMESLNSCHKGYHCDMESLNSCHKGYHCDMESLNSCHKGYHCDMESLNSCHKGYHCGKYTWHRDTDISISVFSYGKHVQELNIKYQQKEIMMIEKQGIIMANTTEEKQINHELCVGEKLLVKKKIRNKVCDIIYDRSDKLSIIIPFWSHFIERIIVDCQKWNERNALNKRAAGEIMFFFKKTETTTDWPKNALSLQEGLTRKCKANGGPKNALSLDEGLTRKCKANDGPKNALSLDEVLTRKYKTNDWPNNALSSQEGLTGKCSTDDRPNQLNDFRDLGLNDKVSFSRHIFWQEITAYPLTQHDPEVNTSQGNPHNFMHYEVFRLCSFSYTRFPANFDVWVTQLAQAGFYCVDENGKIICFDCGQEFQGTVNTPIENAHRSGCSHLQHSRPLHVWTQGLNREVLAIYYNRYGSLRPYNFEASSHAGATLDHSDHTSEAVGRSEFTTLDPQSQQNNDCTSVGTSLGRGSDVPGAIPDGSEPAFREEIRPEYHSESVFTVQNESSRDYPFGRQRHSLPSNLNVVSGAVVSEESQDMSGSHNVLTSAARDPVSVHTVPFREDDSQDSQSGRENGAVGGADSTFDLSKASYPLFSSSTARKQTFATWSTAHSHRPDDLVAAGFFYAGYADCVRCFYCGLGLKFWRDTDIPAYQHARYRPHCVYNRLYKGQDYIDRVQQDILTEQGAANQPTNQVTLPPAAQDNAAPTTVTPAPTTVAHAPTTVAPSPTLADTGVSSVIRVTQATTELPQIQVLMESSVAQAALLNGWERNQVQRAVERIVRDLGENCLEIGLLLDVLMNLYTDNPDNNLLSGNSTDSSDSGITENAMTPSALASIRVPTTENSRMVGAGQRVGVVDVAQAQIAPAALAQPQAPSHQEIFKTVEREHTLLSERITCQVCQLRPVCCIYLPCGHVIACQECADRATHCLFCGKQIVGTANVFLA